MADKKTVTSTEDAPKTHRQKMLEVLYRADFWHDEQSKNRINRKKKLMHREYQQAIWWAIENLESSQKIEEIKNG